MPFSIDDYKHRLKLSGKLDSKMRAYYTPALLNELIALSGLKPARFARVLDVQDASLRFWISDQASPTIVNLKRFRRTFGITFYFGWRGKLFPATCEGLKAAMAHRGYDQIQTAEACGLGRDFVNKFLNGRTGRQNGLSANRWEQFGKGLKCRFYVPPHTKEDVQDRYLK